MNSKKDYIRAAEIVRNAFANHVPLNKRNKLLHWQARETFVVFFQGDNPRFDADRFRDACEPKGQ